MRPDGLVADDLHMDTNRKDSTMWDARIDTADTYDDLADIAVTAFDRWLAADNGFGPLRGKVNMTGVLTHIANRDDGGCPDCADDTNIDMCGGCRAEGIALGAGGR